MEGKGWRRWASLGWDEPVKLACLDISRWPLPEEIDTESAVRKSSGSHSLIDILDVVESNSVPRL